MHGAPGEPAGAAAKAAAAAVEVEATKRKACPHLPVSVNLAQVGVRSVTVACQVCATVVAAPKSSSSVAPATQYWTLTVAVRLALPLPMLRLSPATAKVAPRHAAGGGGGIGEWGGPGSLGGSGGGRGGDRLASHVSLGSTGNAPRAFSPISVCRPPRSSVTMRGPCTTSPLVAYCSARAQSVQRARGGGAPHTPASRPSTCPQAGQAQQAKSQQAKPGRPSPSKRHAAARSTRTRTRVAARNTQHATHSTRHTARNTQHHINARAR